MSTNTVQETQKGSHAHDQTSTCTKLLRENEQNSDLKMARVSLRINSSFSDKNDCSRLWSRETHPALCEPAQRDSVPLDLAVGAWCSEFLLNDAVLLKCLIAGEWRSFTHRTPTISEEYGKPP